MTEQPQPDAQPSAPVHSFTVTHHEEAGDGGGSHHFTTEVLDAEKAIEFIRNIVSRL
jgi:hypothetical protein